MFLPGMHERYGFMYEILAIVIAFLIPKTIIPAVLLLSLSLITYGSNLIYNLEIHPVMGIANFAVYLIYIYFFYKDNFKTAELNKE